jgi:tetratricopeptide (TPR) repeat protein
MYTTAEAYRKWADEPRQKLATAQVESDRQATRRQLMRSLEQAAKYYTDLRALLNRRQEMHELTDVDLAYLRNCYFFIGSLLADMERYDEAIKAFTDAEARVQSDPLVLQIYVEVANCYRRMGRRVEARGALEQAKVVLNRLPPDAPFVESTNYTSAQWQKLLDQYSKW